MIKYNRNFKFEKRLLEYINNSMIKNYNMYFSNNISESDSKENINEAGGVAGIPIISSIHKLYTDVNNIMNNQPKHSPDVTNIKQKINFGFIGTKIVDCKRYTIRIKFDDINYNFKNLISLPNSVIVCHVTDVIINDDIHAAMFIEQLGSKNYYRHQPQDYIENGKFIKGEPETISIDVMAVNGKICPKSFYASFLHEFNHLFQDYTQQLNNSRREYIKKYRITAAIQLISKDIELNNEDKKCLQRVLTNIMNDTEINAYAAGHFGELLGEDIKSNEYKSFIRRSNVWNHILNIQHCIDHILSFDDDKLFKIYNVIKQTKFDELFSSDKIDKSNFKKIFKRNLYKRLQKLIDATTKVASYYFGMTSNLNLDTKVN